MTVFPSEPITVFRTSLREGHFGKSTKYIMEAAQGEANILWHECSTNYKWVWENAIKDSITFHSEYAHDAHECRVAVTAQFEPEDLTYYLMAFEVA
jgi:hypothetical protein